MDFFKILIVGTGGMMGSIGRFAMVKLIDTRLNTVFPYGTLAVNLVGCFLLGLIFIITQRNSGSEGWRLFLGTGFCGGFTTFSAFALENYMMMDQKMVLTSFLYTLVSVIAGILALALGAWCTRFL